jgi:VanZ family protein
VSAAVRYWRFALVLLVVLHLLVLYAPDTGGAPAVPGLDKVVHAATFASVALAGLRAGLAARWWVPVVATHAVVSELVQHWVLPHRSGDPADVLADLAGAALGVLAARFLRRASWAGDRSGPVGDADRTPAGGDAGPG